MDRQVRVDLTVEKVLLEKLRRLTLGRGGRDPRVVGDLRYHSLVVGRYGPSCVYVFSTVKKKGK